MVSKTTISTARTIDVPRSSFARLTLIGSKNMMVSTAILVDEEERDKSLSKSSSKFQKNGYVDQTKLSTCSIDIGHLEKWYLDRLEDSYAYTERYIKCPFFRRRYGDILDDVEGFIRFFLVRPYFQDSTARLGPRISCKSIGKRTKEKNLSVAQLLEILRKDWNAIHNKNGTADATPIDEKGYYVTGKLSTHIYRDDCYFSSPDPDLPLTGLRKYIGVASHLFDSRASRSKLLSLREVPGVENYPPILEAEWKMALTINLPWKPKLSEFTGSTLYFLDEDHLIYKHQETWDISLVDAFWSMMPTWKELHLVSKNKKMTTKTKTETSRCPFAKMKSWISPYQKASTATTLQSNESEESDHDHYIHCINSVVTTPIKEEVYVGR